MAHAQVNPTHYYQLLPRCINLKRHARDALEIPRAPVSALHPRMFNVPRVITPALGCMNCCIPVEAALHFGKRGQMPLAFLVLQVS